MKPGAVQSKARQTHGTADHLTATVHERKHLVIVMRDEAELRAGR